MRTFKMYPESEKERKKKLISRQTLRVSFYTKQMLVTLFCYTRLYDFENILTSRQKPTYYTRYMIGSSAAFRNDKIKYRLSLRLILISPKYEKLFTQIIQITQTIRILDFRLNSLNRKFHLRKNYRETANWIGLFLLLWQDDMPEM